MFSNTAYKERFCQVCDNLEVEDDIHFLCNCKNYENPHRKLFNTIILKCNNFSQMCYEFKLSDMPIVGWETKF